MLQGMDKRTVRDEFSESEQLPVLSLRATQSAIAHTNRF